MTALPKRKPLRSEEYKAYIRAQPCAGCHAPPPSDAHHHGPRGMSQKTDDYRTIPVCRKCHSRFESKDPPMTKLEVMTAIVKHLVGWLRRNGEDVF